MNRLKMAAVTAAALPMLAVGPLVSATAPAAAATTGTMAGLFGSAPNFNTVTNSGKSVCPCKNIAYDFWPGQQGIVDGVGALDKWIATTSGKKTVVAYSKSTHSALGWIRDNPNDFDSYTVQFILLGSPETPGNSYPYEGYKGGHGLPQTGNYDNVTFVVRQYDGIADAPYDKFNLLALMNASMTTHINGYGNLDLDKPDVVYVDPKTGAKTLYFRTDVLPILAPLDWLATDEQMAKLDALLRPLIDAAYRRPFDVAAKPAASAVNARMASLTADLPVDEVVDDHGSGGTTPDGAEAESPTAAPDAEPTVQTPITQTPVVDEVSESVDSGLPPEVESEESVEVTPAVEAIETDEADEAETIAEADADSSTGPQGSASGATPATAPTNSTTASGSGGDSAQTTSGGRHRAPLKGTKSRHSAADAGSSESSAPSSAGSTAD